MRKSLIEHLVSLSDNNNIVILTADVGYPFLTDVPETLHVLNLGSSEQAIAAAAAGFSAQGIFPVIYGIAPFVTTRAAEIYKNAFSHNELSCLVVGVGGGLSYGKLGSTHHSLEDIGVMKSLQIFDLLVPSSKPELMSAVDTALYSEGLYYLRLPDESLVSDQCSESLGFNKLRQSDSFSSTVVITYGSSVQIVKKVMSQVPNADFLSFVSFNQALQEASNLRKYNKIIIVEEAYTLGGLGESILAAIGGLTHGYLIGASAKIQLRPGSGQNLREQLGLNSHGVLQSITRILVNEDISHA